MNVFTIGFTQKTAETFFTKIKASGVQRVVDVRLNNVSQLAGFAKRKDLQFFLREICGVDYVHLPELAPTKDILDDLKKKNGEWAVYEARFMELMRRREIEKRLDPSLLSNGCLLCSEDKPHHCHRRLVAEYLKDSWGDLHVTHM